jgi:hypothetical protein
VKSCADLHYIPQELFSLFPVLPGKVYIVRFTPQRSLILYYSLAVPDRYVELILLYYLFLR